MQQVPKRTWLSSHKGLLCLLIFALVAWVVLIWQNDTSIWSFLQKASWALWVIGGIIVLFILAIIALWIFKSPDKRGQLLRTSPLAVLLIISFTSYWVFKLNTPSTTTVTPPTSSDNFNSTMIAISGAATMIFAFLTLVAAALALLPHPASPRRSFTIIYATREGDLDFALWIQEQLRSNNLATNLELCANLTASILLKALHRHVAQGENVILVLSPSHPLMQTFNLRSRLLLRWMQVYHQNIRGKGELIPILTHECPEDKKRELRALKPANLAKIKQEEARTILLERIDLYLPDTTSHSL